MPVPQQYTYPRYLRSKRTVDDRALNRDVMDTVLASLPTDRAVRIAELGGGVGTMVDRLIETGGISKADYLLVDTQAEFLDEAKTIAPRWRQGLTRNLPSPAPGVSFDVETRHAPLEDWLVQDGDTYDLIIAHAVLDLVDVKAVLPRLFQRLAEGGLFWPTINFDGETIFMPKDPRDHSLMDAYHLSMDERVRDGQPAGSSTAGRELFGHIRAAGGSIVRAGSSDWVVFSEASGYEADEAYFAHHIIHTVEQELDTHPTLASAVRGWGELRHAQVESRELVYIAHQLDFAVGRAD
ncbi:MAG: class I SAM-dependent methyltransferase [Nannocystaceae bacterium]|nr:class I SAM-dependent methyltransferase [Nannocystaceae bacterium]